METASHEGKVDPASLQAAETSGMQDGKGQLCTRCSPFPYNLLSCSFAVAVSALLAGNPAPDASTDLFRPTFCPCTTLTLSLCVQPPQDSFVLSLPLLCHCEQGTFSFEGSWDMRLAIPWFILGDLL